MSMVKQMIEPLDAISQQIWDDSLDDTAFDILRQKTLWLSAQIAVHQVLQNTSRHLLGPQNSSGLSNSQSRLGKFIDVLYGKPDNEKNEARWQKLRDMDCATFLFIAVSYTPLDITKMHRIEFDYLVDNASKFLHVKDLPPRWIFRKEIQIAIAGKADLEEAASFRRKYYALEFNPDILGKGEPAQRNPLGAQDVSKTSNADSKQSINRHTVSNRMISRTFQNLKSNRSTGPVVQRAQQRAQPCRHLRRQVLESSSHQSRNVWVWVVVRMELKRPRDVYSRGNGGILSMHLRLNNSRRWRLKDQLHMLRMDPHCTVNTGVRESFEYVHGAANNYQQK